jgi:hypothetical protein
LNFKKAGVPGEGEPAPVTRIIEEWNLKKAGVPGGGEPAPVTRIIE